MNAEEYQIPRNSLIWILSAQVLCIIPHLPHIPVWAILLAFLCGLWRFLIYQGRANYPKKSIRFILIAAVVSGLIAEYGITFNLNITVAMLVLTYILKLLEMHKLKDAHVVVVMGYFLLAAEFFFNSSLFLAGYQLFVFFINTCAFVSLHRSAQHQDYLTTTKTASILFLQTVPIAIILFLMFPRFAPLWSLAVEKNVPRVGLSDEMSPGDVAKLGGSSDLVFRVKFFGKEPDFKELYWRGIVYSDFDGKTWRSEFSQNNINQNLNWQPNYHFSADFKKNAKQYNYEILMEPSDRLWLFSMEIATDSINDSRWKPDHTWQSNRPIIKNFRYELSSAEEVKLDPQLPVFLHEKNIILPRGYNPKTIQWAKNTFQKSGEDVEIFVNIVQDFFLKNPFFYTLEPGKFGRDSIDDFLFEKQKGFCAHYASAFVVLMRSIGVPTRMVGGYQGGELNAVGRYLMIHQYDAHAWVEYWLPNEGWIRVDPTAWIAPERVQHGFRHMLSQDKRVSENTFEGEVWQRSQALNQLRFWFDYANYTWYRYVVQFDRSIQIKIFENLFGNSSLWIMVSSMAVLITTLLVIFSAFLFFKRRENLNPIDRWYLRWVQMVSPQTGRFANETPLVFYNRVANSHSLTDMQKRSAHQLTTLYMKLQYQPLTPEQINMGLQNFKNEVRKWSKYRNQFRK
ncbi:MAG: DUF3488 and transglutaminase-like domain-containing protein [Pseudomonadota bacterium]